MASRVVATAFGGPDVLSVVEFEVGEPRPGQAVVEVRAAGTNPVDYKLFSGRYGADPSQLPMAVGFEAAGVVTAVGDGAVGPAGPIRVGDEVVGFRVEGAYATHLVAPADTLVPKPSTFSFEEASGMMLTGVTAVHALTVTGVGEGDTVLIHGASGGVGLTAVQLAAGRGARVIGTTSIAGASLVTKYGGEPVAYGDGLLERVGQLAPQGIDAAIDCVGTDEAIDVSVAMVADRGRIATIAGFQRGFELGLRVLGGAPGADPGTDIRNAARLELAALAEAGRLEVPVVATYPLSEAAVALTRLATAHTHGKIILVP
jgi:NADPH:quinone reductase-like Zn-dependent oxidoreductase